MPSTCRQTTIQTYHASVLNAMCAQMALHHNRHSDRPLPLASSSPSLQLSQTVQEEMARRVKADRVLQDLSSDKSRVQARARETARRNKWAKSIASACPPEEIPLVKKQIASQMARQQEKHLAARRGERMLSTPRIQVV